MNNEKGNLVRRFYMALIITFSVLYLCIAFVSTLHAIAFFQLTNVLWLAILLGAAYEVGQATVLFSILMTKNKNKILAWSMMFLLTGLQVTANVFASYKFIQNSGNEDWTYWQESILFWAETGGYEKIWISWIAGALLPIVALGLTALVADNIKLQHEKVDLDYDEDVYEKYDDYDDEEYEVDNENGLEQAPEITLEEPVLTEEKGFEYAEDYAPSFTSRSIVESPANEPEPEIDKSQVLISEPVLVKENKSEPEPAKEPITLEEAISAEHEDEGYDELVKGVVEKVEEIEENKNKPKDSSVDDFVKLQDKVGNIVKEVNDPDEEPDEEDEKIKPVGKTPRGWHFRAEFIDEEGNVFKKGKYSGKKLPGTTDKIPVMKEVLESKKAKE